MKDIEREQKIDYLISNGFKELDIHKQIFNQIDQKVMWFFTFISAVQGYLIVNYFINKSLNVFISKDLILIEVLMIGFIILGFQVFILRGKKFSTGPNVLTQTNSFKDDSKTLLNLKSSTLGTLNQSSNENNKVIGDKSKIFRYSMNLLIIYFIFIIIYFLI
ncbi:hypothetical protein HGA92_03525 [Candidatus Gracilibacteria bacterium]|nr:hypothetical protein [Candidatus Gracilibacteria bacterium]NUJ99168.1 hypothetical protein [Candidatus Gracilibacteria bacterium]